MIRILYHSEEEYLKLKEMVKDDEFEEEVVYEKVYRQESGPPSEDEILSIIVGSVMILIWMIGCALIIWFQSR